MKHCAPANTNVLLKTERLSRLAWLPVPVLLVAVGALWAANLRSFYGSFLLITVLDFGFLTLPSLAVAFLIGRGFLVKPGPGMLGLGCGVLIWGTGSLVTSIFAHGNPNTSATVYALSVWLAACAHLAGVSQSREPQTGVATAGMWIVVSYTVALSLVLLIAQTALTGWMPVFFEEGTGNTLVLYFVLMSAISILVLTATLLRPAKGRPWSAFAYWYALALLLLAVGLFGVMVQPVAGSLLGWTGRLAHYLSGAYMIVAALTSMCGASLPATSLMARQAEMQLRYPVAIVIVTAMTAVRLAFLQSLGTRVAFTMGYPAVILSALYGGWGAGILATLLSAALISYLWIEPVGYLRANPGGDLLSLVTFLINGAAISWIAETMRRAQTRIHWAETQAQVASERERAAQDVRQSEAKHHSLFENMIDGIAYHKIVTDANGKPVDYIFLEVNDAFESLTGLKRLDIIGKRVTKVLPGIENDPADWIGKYGRVAQAGEELRFEQYSAALDKWFSISSFSPMKDHFVAIFEDITARKKAEEAMRQSEERFRIIASSTPDHLFVQDRDLRYTLVVNPQLGLTEQDILGKTDSDFLAKDDAERLTAIKRNVLETGEPLHVEVPLVSRNGQLEVFDGTYVPRFNAQGDVEGLMGYFRNVTERKKAEEALQRSRAELEERVRERTKELAGSQRQLRNLYAHLQSLREEERMNIAREIHDDLGQTLTALKMDLLWIAGKLSDDKEMLKEKLKADVKHIDETIQAVKRVCTELRPAILDHLGLAAAIEWQCEEFQKRTGTKCKIVIAPAEMEVETDLRIALFRVFQEALTNVVRHANATEMEISLTRTPSSILLEIADNGVGITEEELSKGGSFGLLGMRERVFPWGGEVRVSGTRNKGTTVEVTIPITSEASS